MSYQNQDPFQSMSTYLGSFYVTTNLTKEELVRLVSEVIGGKEVFLFSVENSELDISVGSNPDRNAKNWLGRCSAIIEIAIKDGHTQEGWEQIRNLSDMLTSRGIEFETVPDDLLDVNAIRPIK